MQPSPTPAPPETPSRSAVPENPSLATVAPSPGSGLPERLESDMGICLRLLREALREYDRDLLESFDRLRGDIGRAQAEPVSVQGEPGRAQGEPVSVQAEPGGTSPDPTAHGGPSREAALGQAVALVDSLPLRDAQLLARAFATYFHLANLCEENYRVAALHERERKVALDAPTDPVNEMTGAYRRLIDEVGPAQAKLLLERLEFHPVFTAHPTEARRRAVEVKIRAIAELLEERQRLGGSDLAENERALFCEIDALFRTSLIAVKKPTPLEEADTILNIFDATLFETVPKIYRRFDDWALGGLAGKVEPLCPAFFRLGSWIGSDRDGNPNVTARVSRQVAWKFSDHVIVRLEQATRSVARNLTLESATTPPSDKLVALWGRQKELSETLTDRVGAIAGSEPHRAVLTVVADRLRATAERSADLMYANADEYLSDLRCVQRSLVEAGAVRAAYGPLQTLVWQAETFGFHLAEMEFRQHSVVHARALADIRAHGVHGERGALQPMTSEVLDTFRALGAIQKRNGLRAARRYIVSFTKSASDIRDVYELCRLAFARPEDVPVIDVVPLFEQLEDLEGATSVLEEMLRIPEVQQRLRDSGRRLEVMLGYSDSSKDAGPVSATLALHRAQERIAAWARRHDIDLTLFHGRGGAVGRGGGPANRAVLAQPSGSVNCRFKLTEQGEVIFARYGNPVLATRHVESVAAATLLSSAPSIERVNDGTGARYADLAATLDASSHARYLDLVESEGFAPWFETVTPLAEIGLLPIGSRPAKRGLGAQSLDDLRTIPWVFSWSQARINLAAWYGLGTACEELGDIEALRGAYREWPLFTTFIDNIEMSVAKTDEDIARMYLDLGDRDDLAARVLDEMRLTRDWALRIAGDEWPLQHRRVLGQAIRIRRPYVDALSLMQVRALRAMRLLAEKGGLDEGRQREFVQLILCTVSGVAAGLQNTG